VYGREGNDILFGGDGHDRLNGGAGNDYIYGDEGHDVLVGGAGQDYINGGTGNNTMIGGAGDDYITGGGVLFGSSGNDTLVGGSGADSLLGGHGQDDLKGGAGGDIFALRDLYGDNRSWDNNDSLSVSNAFGQSPVVTGQADVIKDWNAVEGDRFLNVSHHDQSRGGYAEFGANVNSIEEAANYANRMYDEGRMTATTGNVFIYNSQTDTGYFLQDWDGDAGHTFETGAILLNSGQATDMSAENLY
jgi:Ca2+-binding RTX toxin-like protein